MPVTLKQRFDPAWEGTPPHISKEDHKIFKRARPRLFKDAVNVYYDVGLGEASEIKEEIKANYKKMWEALIQKRIDVLVETKEYWNIIELRTRASSTAVGRLLQYLNLWWKDPPDQKPVKLILVTDSPDPDLEGLVQMANIELIVV